MKISDWQCCIKLTYDKEDRQRRPNESRKCCVVFGQLVRLGWYTNKEHGGLFEYVLYMFQQLLENNLQTYMTITKLQTFVWE